MRIRYLLCAALIVSPTFAAAQAPTAQGAASTQLATDVTAEEIAAVAATIKDSDQEIKIVDVGRENLGKNGVVRDPQLHAAAVHGVTSAARELGWGTRALLLSGLGLGLLAWAVAARAIQGRVPRQQSVVVLVLCVAAVSCTLWRVPLWAARQVKDDAVRAAVTDFTPGRAATALICLRGRVARMPL